MSDKEKIIYCAALLEGEGSFIKKSKNSMCIQCQMTDEDVLNKLVEYIGGRVVKTKDRKPGKWKTVWVWLVYGQEAEDIARKILPYMGERRSQKIKTLLSDREAWHKANNAFNKAADDAALLYMNSNKSLRQVQRETGVNRQTILRHKNNLEA